MTPRPLLIGLALSTVIFAAIWPPEAYPAGKLAALLASVFAFAAMLTESRISAGYIRAGIAGLALLLLHSLTISVDAYRSLEFTVLLWTYYCLFGVVIHAGAGIEKKCSAVIVAAATVVAVYGLYQFFFGFEQLYSYVAYSSSQEIFKVPALQRIASNRVFSTLALPGTLWAFLLAALPLTLLLRNGSRRMDIVLAASATVLVVAALLTRSFGLVLGGIVLVGGHAAFGRLRLLRSPLTWVTAAAGVGLAAVFYMSRRQGIADANPLTLRFMNWLSSWTSFVEYPLGSGLNNFGVVYPQYALPGANETQFVHNTFLQFTSELGVFFLAAMAALVLWLSGRPGFGISRKPSRGLILALLVWGAHNLIDINVYFGSVGILGTILLGLLFVRSAPPERLPGPGLRAATYLASFAIVAFGGLAMVSSELQYRAQGEYDENKLPTARETLIQARAIMPWNSSLHHDAGDLLFFMGHKLHRPEFLEEAAAAFDRAIGLSPLKVGPHLGKGLYLSSKGQVPEALVEVRYALKLNPNSEYVESVVRLIEKRLDAPASPAP